MSAGLKGGGAGLATTVPDYEHDPDPRDRKDDATGGRAMPVNIYSVEAFEGVAVPGDDELTFALLFIGGEFTGYRHYRMK